MSTDRLQDFYGLPGALLPAKIFDPLATCLYQLLAQALVAHHPAHPMGNALHILWVNQDCSFSRQFRRPMPVSGDNGAPAGHGLQKGAWARFIQ
jgi:hypothetical protein